MTGKASIGSRGASYALARVAQHGALALLLALSAAHALPARAQSPAVGTAAPEAPAAAPKAGAGKGAKAAASPSSVAAPARGTEASSQAADSKPPPAGPATGTRPAARASDRVSLDASQITGNRELPRVLYIVPWRAPDAGDLEGRPVNSLLYELTKPVDREVFRRENRYYDALEAVHAAPEVPPAGAAAPLGAPPSASPGAAPGGPEK